MKSPRVVKEHRSFEKQKEYLWVEYKDRSMPTIGRSICIFKCDVRRLNFRGLILVAMRKMNLWQIN